MDFTVEFYETENGACPVRDFLEELKASDSDAFAAVIAGLAKLRSRQYHRERMTKTNFDRYLDEQLQDPAFAARFQREGEAWDVALQIAALRQQAGLSQKDLAKLLHTSQQQISRLESPSYEGHSLGTLRCVAEALHARVRIVFEPVGDGKGDMQVAEAAAVYRSKRRSARGV